MQNLAWSFAIALVVTVFSTCSWYLGKEPLRQKTLVGTDRTLVILLPTIAGRGLEYEKAGFVEAVRERGFEADLRIYDLNPLAYLRGGIAELLKREVVDVAGAEGYDRIILVGISLGGHGALLYYSKYSDDVDGIVIFAPFLAGAVVSKEIERADGLNKWEDCPFFSTDYACNMWKLLKDTTQHTEKRRKIILGYGTDDSFAERNRLLGEALPAENVFTYDGGHDWMTWKQLWIWVMDELAVRCGSPGKGFCVIKEKKLR